MTNIYELMDFKMSTSSEYIQGLYDASYDL